jgi:tetratricopeptide (TPR) repeat protein
MSAPLESVLPQAATALSQGRFDEAARLVQPWTQPPREHPVALQILGLAQAGRQQFDAAEAALRRVVELAPGYAVGWANLGRVQLQRGHAEAAVQTLAQASALDPRLADAHLNRGLALMKLNQPELALAGFARAAELEPEHPRSLYNHALALHQMGREDEAQILADRVTARWSDYALGWNLLGMIGHKRGRYQEAFDAYSQALRRDPRLADTWVYAAEVLLLLHRHAQARAFAERAVQLAPDYLPALRMMGTALWYGDYSEK